VKFDIGDPVESTTGLLFIHDNEDFINELRKAKSLKIEADFFQEVACFGLQVLSQEAALTAK
jgi:hypothetical protein